MNMRALALVAIALPLAGCQSTSGELSEVDRQAQILAAVPSNYRQAIPMNLRGSISDPTAIQNAEISTPFLGSPGSGASAGVTLVCVRLQSATAPGGQTVALVFDDGRIVNSQWNSPACARATYGPYPELSMAFRSPPA